MRTLPSQSRFRRAALAGLLTFLAPTLPAQPKLPGVGAAMESMIAAGEINGAVTLVASDENILHLETTGYADLAKTRPMRPDTIFWVASMTKLVTSASILALKDDGKLRIEDPVSKFLPEFKDLRTPSGRLANLTLLQLLTHTSGLAEAPPEVTLASRKLADLIPSYVAKPTQFEPGTQWRYCQSGLNTLARIVEVVSGQPFEEFLRDRFFHYLQMNDTTFYLTEEQVTRLAEPYGKNKTTGALEHRENMIIQNENYTARDRPPIGAGGLFTTAVDFERFCEMLLNDGIYGARIYLRRESVLLMRQSHTAGIPGVFAPMKGHQWGLGCAVVEEPQGVTAMLSPGTFGHSGAYGTQAWMDPARRVVMIMLVSRAGFPMPDDNPVRQAFQQSVTDALDR
jgi:CubicO group peptidase (beta-lactamase class C family)